MRKAIPRHNAQGCLLGVELTKILIEKGMYQGQLCKLLDWNKMRVSAMMTGDIYTTPDNIAKVAKVLSLDEQSTYRLHIAAARDCGYRIPLFTIN